MSQSNEFCRHNTLCCLWTSNTKGKRIFRYRFSPETFGYIMHCLYHRAPAHVSGLCVTLLSGKFPSWITHWNGRWTGGGGGAAELWPRISFRPAVGCASLRRNSERLSHFCLQSVTTCLLYKLCKTTCLCLFNDFLTLNCLDSFECEIIWFVNDR
jgi:hypothetical protein